MMYYDWDQHDRPARRCSVARTALIIAMPDLAHLEPLQ